MKEIKLNPAKGKYLQAYPNVELIYNRSLRKRHSEIIRNGESFNPVPINGAKMYVSNTCGFDSMTEILTNCYLNYLSFENATDFRSDILFFYFFVNRLKKVFQNLFIVIG